MSKSAKNDTWAITLTSNGTVWTESPSDCHCPSSSWGYWQNDSSYSCQIQFTSGYPFTGQPGPIEVSANSPSPSFQVKSGLPSGEQFPYTVQTATAAKKQANVRSAGTGGPIIIIDPAPTTGPEKQKGGRSQHEPELAGTGSKRR